MPMSNKLKVIVFLLVLTSLVACSRSRVDKGSQSSLASRLLNPGLSTWASEPRQLLTINRVMIAPLSAGRQVAADPSTLSKWEQSLHSGASQELGAGLLMLNQNQNSDNRDGSSRPRDHAIRSARKLGSDAVLLAEVTRYSDRLGSELGASEPALVGFDMEIVRVSDGQGVWRGSYSYKDQAVSENLFKIREDVSLGEAPHWSSADELLAKGFRAALKDFADRRLEQFSADKRG